MTPAASAIVHCTNSTIAEAWAAIVGLPGPIDDADAPLIARAARESFAGLKEKPAIVAVSGSRELATPFWLQQCGWDEDRYLARFGHRYLSVHFVKQKPEERYDTYSKTLRPQVTGWLDVEARALGASAAEYGVDRVAFGYVNRFAFPADGFDVSRFFKLNVGFDIGPSASGLLGLGTMVRVYDAERVVYLTVELSAEGPTDERAETTVTTKVVAEKRGLEGLSFADASRLDETITAAKDAAKETFFRFATAETHRMMGAVTDASG